MDLADGLTNRALGKNENNGIRGNSNCKSASPFRKHSRVFVTSRRSFWPLLILLGIAMNLPQTSPKRLQEMLCRYIRYKDECYRTLNETAKIFEAKGEPYCKGDFDDYICWPHGQSRSLVNESCPDFIDWKNDSLQAYRYCGENGTWLTNVVDGQSVIWHHRKQCDSVHGTEMYEIPKESEVELVNVITVMYTSGYWVSLVCLVASLFLLTFFKKLHCTRNYIHMNLMLSFIIRYVAVLVKDKVISDQYNLEQFHANLSDEKMAEFCIQYDGPSTVIISCRLVLVLMQYAVLANYFWLLIEGIYLQLLLAFVMSEVNYFPMFMAFGWGAPWIFVGVWVALKVTEREEGCWVIYKNERLLWVLEVPVMVTIATNFLIFSNIVRMIVVKLKARNMRKTDYKYRLARSTLALIPLLGIHYFVFIIFHDQTMTGNKTAFVRISFEMVFTSIQGALIALMYCFLNGEVQAEIHKVWRAWRWKNGLPPPSSRKWSSYNNSGVTQVTTCQSNIEQSHQETTLTLLPQNGNGNPQHAGSADADGMRSDGMRRDELIPVADTTGPNAAEEV